MKIDFKHGKEERQNGYLPAPLRYDSQIRALRMRLRIQAKHKIETNITLAEDFHVTDSNGSMDPDPVRIQASHP